MDSIPALVRTSNMSVITLGSRIGLKQIHYFQMFV